ncbi:MAG: hypothetical protein AAFX81_11995 [Pseudomonadota bacterium]
MFALGVVVEDEHHQAFPVAGAGPLQHLPIAVRITERGDQSFASDLVDADGFAGFVVHQVDVGFTNQLGRAVDHDVGRDIVRPQVVEQLEWRLVGEVRVQPIPTGTDR